MAHEADLQRLAWLPTITLLVLPGELSQHLVVALTRKQAGAGIVDKQSSIASNPMFNVQESCLGQLECHNRVVMQPPCAFYVWEVSTQSTHIGVCINPASPVMPASRGPVAWLSHFGVEGVERNKLARLCQFGVEGVERK
jgi:hypothetical protein